MPYSLGTVCAAVPVTKGLAPECVALSLPLQHAHRLEEAARILQDEAAAVLLGILVTGTAQATEPTETGRRPGMQLPRPHHPQVAALSPPARTEPNRAGPASVSLATL